METQVMREARKRSYITYVISKSQGNPQSIDEIVEEAGKKWEEENIIE